MKRVRGRAFRMELGNEWEKGESNVTILIKMYKSIRCID